MREPLERSSEFIAGYEACAKFISRSQNPYKVKLPPPGWERTAYDDWRAGWNKRFFGENINSQDPDP